MRLLRLAAEADTHESDGLYPRMTVLSNALRSRGGTKKSIFASNAVSSVILISFAFRGIPRGYAKPHTT